MPSDGRNPPKSKKHNDIVRDNIDRKFYEEKNSKKVFYIFLKKQKSNNLFDIRKSNNFLNFFLGTPWLYQTSPSTRATRCCSPFSRI